MITLRRYGCLFLVLQLLCFRGVSQTEIKGHREVIILHTNDMHAKIDNLAKLAYLKDSLKISNPNVYLVAAGDNFTGNPVVDMATERGYPMIDLMNQCCFDLTAFGNHEFDMGLDFLARRISQARFPFICSNFDVISSPLFQPIPYCILSHDSLVNLAVLGILQLGENGLPDSHPLKLKGLRFFDGLVQSKEYLNLKEKYGNLIALSHLGIDDDLLLAEKFPEFDVIIGGHSHTLLDTQLISNGVLITQAGSHLRYVGKITLEMTDNKVVSRKSEIIPFTKLNREKLEIRALIEKYNLNPELNKPIAHAESPQLGYAALGSMMTDALTHILKVDFAFQNRGGIRIDSLAAGDITLKDIYRLDPFGNQVVVLNMSWPEIKSLIRYSFEIKNAPDLEVSGMKYTVITDKNHHFIDVETDLPVQKSKKPENRVYKVALNSYVASRYVFDHQDAGEIPGPTTADLLIEFLKEKQTVDYSKVRRVFVKEK